MPARNGGRLHVPPLTISNWVEPHDDNLPKLSPEDLEKLQQEVNLVRQKMGGAIAHKKNIDVLETMLSEYFDSFLIFAYTPEGDEVVVRKALTPRDHRAVDNLLHEYVAGGIMIGPEEGEGGGEEDDDY